MVLFRKLCYNVLMDREKLKDECEELEAPFAFLDFSKSLVVLNKPKERLEREKNIGQFRPMLDA